MKFVSQRIEARRFGLAIRVEKFESTFKVARSSEIWVVDWGSCRGNFGKVSWPQKGEAVVDHGVR